MAVLECQAAECLPPLGSGREPPVIQKHSNVRCLLLLRGFQVTEHSDASGNGKEGARDSHVAAAEQGQVAQEHAIGHRILNLSLPAPQS